MKKINWKSIVGPSLILLAIAFDVWAESNESWGDVADTAVAAIDDIGKLITAGSYLAGLGFSIGAIMQFKQHKDNPTQVTIGKPIAMTFIAAALLFLPSVLKATGSTLFSDATTAGPKGCTINKNTGKCV